MPCDPHPHVLHLVWFPPLSPLPFCLSYPHRTTPPPPPSLSLSIPGFIPSSLISLHPSNPHLFLIGAVERVSDGGLSRCVWYQKWMSGRTCGDRQAELMTTARERAEGEEDWPKTCQSIFTGVSSLVSGWSFVSWHTYFVVAPCCSDRGSDAEGQRSSRLKKKRLLSQSTVWQDLPKLWRMFFFPIRLNAFSEEEISI